jgi:hypothetical protein
MPVRSGCMPVKKALRPRRATLLGVVVREERTFISDAIDVGRLSDHQAAVIDARLHVADVIAHDEENVRLALCLCRDLLRHACYRDQYRKQAEP